MTRWLRSGAAWLTLLVSLIVLGGLTWRALAQRAAAQALAITTPDGIAEGSFVRIGDSEQWVTIRGEHRRNPVLLMVHGGPGFALSPFAPVFRRWERDFTIVQWDQRNAGRTFSRNGEEPISIDLVTRDGLAVVEHVRRRLGAHKVIVLGYSWGSAIALNMVHRRPDLFTAYIGIGQMADTQEQERDSYRRVLSAMRAANNTTAVRELLALGPLERWDEAARAVERKWAERLGSARERNLYRDLAPVLIAAPGQSLREVWDYQRAPSIAQPATFAEAFHFDARRLGTRFAMPVIVIGGADDLNTPVRSATQWIKAIDAPYWAIDVAKGQGHNFILTAPDAFFGLLKRQLARAQAAASKPQLTPIGQTGMVRRPKPGQ